MLSIWPFLTLIYNSTPYLIVKIENVLIALAVAGITYYALTRGSETQPQPYKAEIVKVEVI